MADGYTNDVFHLNPGEEVSCYYCAKDGDHTSYKRGEAFLANPGHSPCNGDANYICKRHLDCDAVLYEPFPATAAPTETK